MPEPIHCPSCNAKVRVPERMWGKKVRCPKCQSAFTAAAEEPDEPEGVVTEPTPAVRRRAVPVEEPEYEESAPSEDEDRPRKRPRRKRRSRRSEEAEAAVAAPAICLMVFGGLNIALLVLDLVFRFLNVSLLAAGAGGPAQPADDAEAVGVVLGGIGDVIGIALAAFLIFGAVKMKQLQNYGLVMGASICTLLPCWPCCLLGIPLGIWALIMLNRPEVREAFT